MSYPKTLTKGYKSLLEKTQIEDGKIRITVDTGEMFVDLDGARIEISDIVKGMTEEQIRSTIAPLPKLYLSTDTRKLLTYDNEIGWVVIAESNSSIVAKALEADHATNATNASTAEYSKNAGTAVYAEQAESANSATNANRALEADQATSATNASTAEYSKNAGTAVYAEQATNASTAEYSKNASTAEYATNASTATYAETASNANTSDLATNASTAEYAKNASTAIRATNAGTAVYAEQAESANSATNATNASTAEYATNASTATYAENAYRDANGKLINTTYAPLASPIFTGTPTVPTPSSGDNSTKIANTEFVTTTVLEALSTITGYKNSLVDSFEDLPNPGETGVHYFVPANSDDENNLYDEYIWFDSLSKYEKIGSPTIDLEGYFNNFEVTGTGNAVTAVNVSGGKLTFTKGASFLTAHPSISKNSSTSTASPSSGGTINVVKSLTLDTNGHVTDFVLETVTLPNKVTNASTAEYANNAGTAVNAGTATYATNAGTATYGKNAGTAAYATKAGSATNATSATNAGTATYATNASTAEYSKNAGTAAYATKAESATNAGTATYGTNAGTATYGKNAGTANYSKNSGTATYATNAATATVAKGILAESDLDFGDLDE